MAQSTCTAKVGGRRRRILLETMVGDMAMCVLKHKYLSADTIGSVSDDCLVG